MPSFNTITRFSGYLPAIVLLGLIASSPDLANAAPNFGGNTDILKGSCSLLMTIKRWLFTVVYVLGAIGLVLIAISAFLGRFKFAHLFALGGGLFIVAAANLIISFVTGGTANANNCSA